MTNPTQMQLDKFNEQLDKFNLDHKLERQTLKVDTFLQEGAEWLLKLRNGEQFFVHRCSYWVKNPEVDYLWVDYRKEKGVTIEINYVDKTIKEFTIISPSEINSVELI